VQHISPIGLSAAQLQHGPHKLVCTAEVQEETANFHLPLGRTVKTCASVLLLCPTLLKRQMHFSWVPEGELAATQSTKRVGLSTTTGV
jgi:hypothetical protein